MKPRLVPAYKQRRTERARAALARNVPGVHKINDDLVRALGFNPERLERVTLVIAGGQRPVVHLKGYPLGLAADKLRRVVSEYQLLSVLKDAHTEPVES